MKVGPAPSNTNTMPCFDILPISSPVTCQDQAHSSAKSLHQTFA